MGWSVSEWLQTTPDPSSAPVELMGDANEQRQHPPAPRHRKRKLSITQSPSPSPRKIARRLPLAELNQNVAVMDERRSSPRKRGVGGDHSENTAEDATPRPSRNTRSSKTVPSRVRQGGGRRDTEEVSYGSPRRIATSARGGAFVPAPSARETGVEPPDARFTDMRLPPPHPSPPTSSPSRSTTASLQSASSSRRSKSPVKSTADLRLTDVEIAYTDLDSTALPRDVAAMAERMRAIQNGIAIVPEAVEQEVGLRGGATVYQWSIAHDTSTDDLLDPVRELDMVDEVWRAAKLCHRSAASEPAWNDEVHSCVFRIAFRQFAGIRAHNV